MLESFVSTTSTPDVFVCYDVELLLLQLQSNSPVERQHARETLGKIGKHVTPSLLHLLAHRNEHVRWEACKTLARIKDSKTGYPLAEMLLDDDADVRWVAAEALIALEEKAIEPLLRVLEINFDSVLLREAAHHVLRELRRENFLDEKTEAVYEALGSVTMPVQLAVKANEALNHIRERRISMML